MGARELKHAAGVGGKSVKAWCKESGFTAIDFSKPSKKKATTMKVIVWVCLLNGLTKILFKSLHMILL